MKCKVCGKDTMKQDGERYVCENCGAVAVKVNNTKSKNEKAEKQGAGNA